MSARLRDLDDDLGAAFRSADRDAPRPGAKAALVAALGVGVVAAASTATAGAAAAGAAGAGAAGAGAAGGSSIAAAKGVGLAVVAKWFIASAVIVGGAAATVHAVSAPGPAVTTAATNTHPATTGTSAPAVNPALGVSPAHAPSAASPPPAELAPLASVALVAPRPPVGPVATEAALGVAARSADSPRAPAPGATTHGADAPERGGATATGGEAAATVAEEAPRRATVADEIAALDRVRSLLAGGNGGGALDALREYRRAFAGGVLAQEASVLEIESRAAAGQHDRARALGESFVAEHPRSPLVPRVQRAMGK